MTTVDTYMARGAGAGSELPPHAQIIQMATSYWPSRLVHAAAKLGLADHLFCRDLHGVVPRRPFVCPEGLL